MMPSGGFWGGVGEPTICRGGAGGAQRVLRGDRQAHPLGAACPIIEHLHFAINRN